MIELFRPTDTAQAVALLQHAENAAVISGGTALLQEICDGRRNCSAWISTDALGLDRIESVPDGVCIGASAVLDQIKGSALMQEAPYTLLREAIHSTASWQIRNVATLGGCIASGNPVADPVCALLALEAELVWQDATGTHRAPLERFYGEFPEKLPVKSIITHIFLPRYEGCHFLIQFRKASVRKAFSWPLVNFAAVVPWSNNGSLGRIRIAVGGMGSKTLLLKNTAATIPSGDFSAVTTAYSAEVSPKDSLQGSADYKRLVCRNYLLELWETLHKTEAPVWT